MKSESGYDYSWAMEAVKPMQMKEYLGVLAAEPHLAGLERDEYLANWIADTWRNLSLDEVIKGGMVSLVFGKTVFGCVGTKLISPALSLSVSLSKLK